MPPRRDGPSKRSRSRVRNSVSLLDGGGDCESLRRDSTIDTLITAPSSCASCMCAMACSALVTTSYVTYAVPRLKLTISSVSQAGLTVCACPDMLTLSVHRHVHLLDLAIRAKDFAHMRLRDILGELLDDNLCTALWRCRAS